MPLPGPIVDGTTYRYVVSRSTSTGWVTGKVETPNGDEVTVGTVANHGSFGAVLAIGGSGCA